MQSSKTKLILLLLTATFISGCATLPNQPLSRVNALENKIVTSTVTAKATNTKINKPVSSLKTNTETTGASLVSTSATGDIPANTIRTSLVINDQNYTAEIAPNSIVYDLMKKLQDDKIITFTGKEFSGMGYFIESINGISSSAKEKKYWIYYINNKKATIGISAFTIHPNDIISWRYENEQ